MENVKYAAILLGIFAGYILIWQRRNRLRLRDPLQAAVSCIVLCALSVLSAKIFATMEALISGEGFSFGPISTYGVYFLCPPILLIIAKVLKLDVKDWFDVYALCTAPTMFLLRCCCLVSGCYGGRAIGTTGFQWPTRQAEMIFYVVMLSILLHRERTGTARGMAFPLLVASYGIFRFVEEWFRAGECNSLLHLAHGWSVIACIIGAGLYLELSSQMSKRRASKC